MRHGVSGRKLGRPGDKRWSMLRNLVTNLITHGRICTTLTRAKELRGLAEHAVTLAKRGTHAAAVEAQGYVYSKVAYQRLLSEMPGRFADRNGGYTRIIPVGHRYGDNAPMAYIGFVDILPSRKTLENRGVSNSAEKDLTGEDFEAAVAPPS